MAENVHDESAPVPGRKRRVYCWMMGAAVWTDEKDECPECGSYVTTHRTLEGPLCQSYAPCPYADHGHACGLPIGHECGCSCYLAAAECMKVAEAVQVLKDARDL